MIKVICEEDLITIYTSEFKSGEMSFVDATYSIHDGAYVIVGRKEEHLETTTVKLPIQQTIIFEV